MVERDGRAIAPSFFVEAALAPGVELALPEGAAHHARVKRMEAGDRVRLLDGVGLVAHGEITTLDRRSAVVAVRDVERIAPPRAIHLRVPVADRDRMLWLAEKATELGVASWQAVRFRRSASVSPRGEGEAFGAKVRTRMIAALEQSGGAWLPRILPDVSVGDLSFDAGQLAIVLDRAGAPLASIVGAAALEPVLLVGPEGGIETDEMAALTDAGWRSARLADSVLRFETAGVAAAAVCRNAQLIEEN